MVSRLGHDLRGTSERLSSPPIFVLCVSRYTRARVLSWAAIEPERVIVLPNTVSEAFTPGECRFSAHEMGP